MEGREDDWKGIVSGLIFSVFETVGPTPVVCFPEDMDDLSQLAIAMKSISLLMGESVYQEGEQLDSIKYCEHRRMEEAKRAVEILEELKALGKQDSGTGQ